MKDPNTPENLDPHDLEAGLRIPTSTRVGKVHATYAESTGG